MEEEKKESSLREIVKFAVIAALIIIPFRLWIAQPFIVSGASMEPTFYNGDYLIIDEISYNLREPQKGEVIVFRYPLDPTKFFIKRVIGVPGEIVAFNGTAVTLGENEYYVLGDNREESSDSRIWGAVPENLIVGRGLIRLWPLNKIGMLPGDQAAATAHR